MKEIEIEWCPTKKMVADFMTKPLQGSHFRRLRDFIMGMSSIEKAKIPSPSKGMPSVKKAKIPRKSTVTVTKRDGPIKVRELERSRWTAVRSASPTSVGLLAQ
jgi:hypothetical protein